jgi:hypothetical protein
MKQDSDDLSIPVTSVRQQELASLPRCAAYRMRALPL